MINVCLVSPLPPPIGGIALWTSNIINYQQKDVNFFALNTNVDNHPAKKRTFFDRFVKNGFKMLKIRRQLKRIVKENKIDCVHICTSGSFGFIRDKYLVSFCKRKNIKVVLHLHFGRMNVVLKDNSWESKMFFKISKMVSRIICMDSNTFKCLSGFESIQNKVLYVPNPIAYKTDFIKQENKLKKVIYVGWVIKSKGIEELITSWNIVGNKYKDWSLEIVGACDKNYKQELDKMIKVSNIDFLGEMQHDDCLARICESSILVLPSYTEGFPNVILEAMMSSTPIIATKVGEIPSILSSNSGVVINHHSSEEIIKSLENLICNQYLREQFAINAYRRVNENYTIQKVFSLLLKEWGAKK